MSDPEQKVWPGESGEAYPDVFTKIPPQPTEKKPGQLSEDQIIQFFDKVKVDMNSGCKRKVK